MGTSEHSPVDPKPRGAAFACIYIENGTEVFRADGLFRQTDWGGRAIIGDGIIATLDTYDQRIYAVGKGPSAVTVTAPNIGAVVGKSIVIQGTVTDISAGTNSDEVAARFPNGVAAVSDDSQNTWMLYVYKNFARPTNASGVEVTIDVIDSNGNYRNIGTATSDSTGMFSLQWQPDIDGKYTVIATFAGSKAYYPSFAETSFAADPMPEITSQPIQSTVLPPFEMYIVGVGIAILAAIGILGFLLLRNRS